MTFETFSAIQNWMSMHVTTVKFKFHKVFVKKYRWWFVCSVNFIPLLFLKVCLHLKILPGNPKHILNTCGITIDK